MNIHQNARLTPKGRELLIARLERGEHVCDVACALEISVRTVYKWKKRHHEHGLAGLQDRSSRPLASPARTSTTVEMRLFCCANSGVHLTALPSRLGSHEPLSGAS